MKPFIPAWLDSAGLSQSDFRLYCHLVRRADNSTDIAWPSADTAAATCGMARNTFWKSIGRLESAGAITRLGKKFGGSNRYKINAPFSANETPIDEPPIGANEIPIEGDTIGANGAPNDDAANRIPFDTPIGANEIRQSAQMDSREGNPKKVIQRRKSNKSDYSLEAVQFAVWFKGSLPTGFDLQSNWQNTFSKAFDDLVRIDKRDPEEIRKVCQWARQSWWKDKFYSPGKLRKRNPDGIKYFDVFSEQMKPAKTTAPVAATSMSFDSKHQAV